MEVVKPRWTSGSFLLYAGGLTVLVAAVWSRAVYVFLAKLLGRSSWAVLGAFGVTLSAAYFAAKWSVVPYFSDEFSRNPYPWAGAVVFAVLGFLLVALGLLSERRSVEQDRI